MSTTRLFSICRVWGRATFVAPILIVASIGVPSESRAAEPKRPKVAAIVTAYYHNSHADVIVSRLLQTNTLDNKGERPTLDLASLYIDQPRLGKEGLEIARENRVPVFNSVAEALTLGGKMLAVDAVLLIAEHGMYPRSATGQMIYPKRRLFKQIVAVFDQSGRVVPVFSDKHLADNWEDAKWIYNEARRRNIPLMAGSSLPTLWRYPPIDVRRGERIQEVVATSYGALDAYGFHALEILECLVERRAGGESGVRSVQTLMGEKVWDAQRRGLLDQDLLSAAISRRKRSTVLPREDLERTVKDPVLFVVNYRDGLRASILFGPNRINEWAVAWRDADSGKVESTLFWTQEARPFMHFTYLLKDIEKMVATGRSPRPVERTLLTTGILDALFISRKEGGRVVETPYLDISYQPRGDWHQPPPPPPGRPLQGQ
jgi:hypothetical protein